MTTFTIVETVAKYNSKNSMLYFDKRDNRHAVTMIVERTKMFPERSEYYSIYFTAKDDALVTEDFNFYNAHTIKSAVMHWLVKMGGDTHSVKFDDTKRYIADDGMYMSTEQIEAVKEEYGL